MRMVTHGSMLGERCKRTQRGVGLRIMITLGRYYVLLF